MLERFQMVSFASSFPKCTARLLSWNANSRASRININTVPALKALLSHVERQENIPRIALICGTNQCGPSSMLSRLG
ncbi:hypothetical protein M413DRAFT_192634 [Hebeloma cylindrosporum]|uniref:Uncharacterized protein n=1 Tax=Hebeloma cylindrosporum TaxID=76867 RepID=A0A0C3C7G1_HEBCY|nr:hypothetical protein M413DRAFT_192634 [Hebeloma cylindrosporum h7]